MGDKSLIYKDCPEQTINLCIRLSAIFR